jgi:sulfotransferase
MRQPPAITTVPFDRPIETPKAQKVWHGFHPHPALRQPIHVEYHAPDFDLPLGVPGLHGVKPKVAFTQRRTVIPPGLFDNDSKMTFWTGPAGSAAKVIAPKTQIQDSAP